MLDKIDTRAPKSFDKDKTKQELQDILVELEELQNLLYAEHKRSVLVIIQGMDASGKDGLIKDVFGALNPQGVSVTSFKVPTEEELAYDFLWRIHKATPGKGIIGVFNRSQYEDVLVTRVHGITDDKTAKERMTAINNFEQLLEKHSNTLILKIYLHVSHEEQKERLAERMKVPEKMWKYNAKDFEESAKWATYMKYYEAVFEHCNKTPWHIVPADQNWYKSYTVAVLLRDMLKEQQMKYPGMKQ